MYNYKHDYDLALYVIQLNRKVPKNKGYLLSDLISSRLLTMRFAKDKIDQLDKYLTLSEKSKLIYLVTKVLEYRYCLKTSKVKD